MRPERLEENPVAATFETVLGLIRPLLQRRLGDFETMQVLQTVRDEWHKTRLQEGPEHG